MIQLSRLNGDRFVLNTDLIERIDETPDTVLTLVDGTKYVVAEPIDDVIDRVIGFRARVVASAEEHDPVVPLQLVPVISGPNDDSLRGETDNGGPSRPAGSPGGDNNLPGGS